MVSKREKNLAKAQEEMRKEIPMPCEIDEEIGDLKMPLPLGIPFTDAEWRKSNG